MSDLDKWGKNLLPEEERDYLRDLCALLREQEAAHYADIIEELWDRSQQLEKFPKFIRARGEK